MWSEYWYDIWSNGYLRALGSWIVLLIVTIAFIWFQYRDVKRVVDKGEQYNWESSWKNLLSGVLGAIMGVGILRAFDGMVVQPPLWIRAAIFLLACFGLMFVLGWAIEHYKSKYGLYQPVAEKKQDDTEE